MMSRSDLLSSRRDPAAGPPAHYPLGWHAVMMLCWLIALGAALVAGHGKLAAISVIAFAAMVGGWALAVPLGRGKRLMVGADGLAAGAMLASAALFLLPMAMKDNPGAGSVGVAAGLVLGIALDRLLGIEHAGRTARDTRIPAITVHAGAAGIVIGLLYARMPALGMALGTVIVSHKLPAGYVLARSRQALSLATWPILWPAAMVGLTAIPVSLCVAPGTPGGSAGLFGLATGVFMHVGQDFSRARFGAHTPASQRGFVLALVVGALVTWTIRMALPG